MDGWWQEENGRAWGGGVRLDKQIITVGGTLLSIEGKVRCMFPGSALHVSAPGTDHATQSPSCAPQSLHPAAHLALQPQQLPPHCLKNSTAYVLMFIHFST